MIRALKFAKENRTNYDSQKTIRKTKFAKEKSQKKITLSPRGPGAPQPHGGRPPILTQAQLQ